MSGYPGRIRSDFASLKRAGIPGGDGYRGPHTTFTVDGSGTRPRRCLKCQTINQLPPSPLAETEGRCRTCHRITTQEMVL